MLASIPQWLILEGEINIWSYLGRQRELCELPVLELIRNHAWGSFMMFLEHLEPFGGFQTEKTAAAALLPNISILDSCAQGHDSPENAVRLGAHH